MGTGEGGGKKSGEEAQRGSLFGYICHHGQTSDGVGRHSGTGGRRVRRVGRQEGWRDREVSYVD